MVTNIHLDTNARGKIEIFFLLWYSSHFIDEFLRVYRLKCSSLVMEFFFSNTLTIFLIFPKNAFSRASIGTRASTGTFTSTLFPYFLSTIYSKNLIIIQVLQS